MKKKTIKYFSSFILTINFIILGVLGIIIFPGFLNFLGIRYISFPKAQVFEIHHLLGILLIILLSIHMVLHWKWMVVLSRKIFKNIKLKTALSIRLIGNYSVNIILLLVFTLLILTGLVKYPGLINFIGLDITSIPLNEISALHDWSGLTAFILTIFHLGFFFKKLNLFKRKKVVS